jgi:hypothetical protein
MLYPLSYEGTGCPAEAEATASVVRVRGAPTRAVRVVR